MGLQPMTQVIAASERRERRAIAREYDERRYRVNAMSRERAGQIINLACMRTLMNDSTHESLFGVARNLQRTHARSLAKTLRSCALRTLDGARAGAVSEMKKSGRGGPERELLM